MNTTKYFALKKYIEKLKELSANSAPIESHIQLLNQIGKSHTTKAIAIENNQILYRSRINKKGYLFQHLGELKYPKSIDVTSKGRLNDVGQSIFYTSSSLLGTIIESRFEINDIVTVSKIKKRSNSLVNFLALGFRNHMFSTAPENKCHKLVVDYLNDELTKKVTTNDGYNSTIAISNFFMNMSLLYGPDRLDAKNSNSLAPYLGLLYPSVQSQLVSNKTTQNLAMTPSLYEDYFVIFEAEVYCMILNSKNVPQNTAVLVPINNGSISDDGYINWKFSYLEMVNRASNGINCYGHSDECLKKIEF